MRIAIVADVHIGNHRRFGGPMVSGVNDRCSQAIRTLQQAIRLATVQNEVEALIVAGDLFDAANVSPQIITATQDVLIDGQPAHHQEWRKYIMAGNHDLTSDAFLDHALGPLRPVARVEIVERPLSWSKRFLQDEVWMLPFQTGIAREWIPEALEGLHQRSIATTPRKRILILHAGISDERTPPWLKNARDAIDVHELAALCRRYNIIKVFAGNWHDRRVWDLNGQPMSNDVRHYSVEGDIFQLGALCPTGFDNPGLDGYGTVAIFDGSDNRVALFEVPGPRFIKITDSSQLSQIEKGFAHRLYIEWTCPPEDLDRYNAAMADIRATNGAISGWEVLASDDDAKVAARTAATMAKSAQNVDEAVAMFVAEMPLPEHVDRGLVLAKTKKYLGGA